VDDCVASMTKTMVRSSLERASLFGHWGGAGRGGHASKELGQAGRWRMTWRARIFQVARQTNRQTTNRERAQTREGIQQDQPPGSRLNAMARRGRRHRRQGVLGAQPGRELGCMQGRARRPWGRA
jgi:hypothetical protein